MNVTKSLCIAVGNTGRESVSVSVSRREMLRCRAGRISVDGKDFFRSFILFLPFVVFFSFFLPFFLSFYLSLFISFFIAC